MVTALPAGAMITGVRFPRPARRRSGSGFAEIARRHGDFALAAAAASLTLDAAGTITGIALAIGGATPMPTPLALADLIGERPEHPRVGEAVVAALAALDMMADAHGSAAYRRRAATRLAHAALAEAAAEAAAKEVDDGRA
jgi:CO/xanthine dehydrogenase FAD-binding subunit